MWEGPGLQAECSQGARLGGEVGQRRQGAQEDCGTEERRGEWVEGKRVGSRFSDSNSWAQGRLRGKGVGSVSLWERGGCSLGAHLQKGAKRVI